MNTTKPDADLIDRLGGTTQVAKLVTERSGGVCTPQRVQNWKERGIPPAMKIALPDLFMPELVARATPEPLAPASEGGAA